MAKVSDGWDLGGCKWYPGDRIVINRFWVSSDGDMPGYTSEGIGILVKITPCFVMHKFDEGDRAVRRLRRELFLRVNSEAKRKSLNG